MLRSTLRLALLAVVMIVLAAPWGVAQERLQRESNDDYDDYRQGYGNDVRIDRYLDVEIWPNHSDGDYLIDDQVVLSFRASRDCYVAVYSIDTRGRVNLLFPSSPLEDNFVVGSETYRLPGAGDDYDLFVTGPEGFEHIQIIASRERFPIPNWYRNSGLVDDWEDRYAFMDHLNQTYFTDYPGQRFAYDRAVIYVNDWEPYYYRPIYRPYYPHWTIVGNTYIDYGWGYSVYVNGIYWGCTPLYIPRVAIGWHTVTIYDHHGHCWEDDIHVTHYNTVVLNKTVIKTSPSVRSKYKTVRTAGYRDPAMAGYKTFKARDEVVGSIVKNRSGAATTANRGSTVSGTRSTVKTTTDFTPDNRYARGSTKLVKTGRGYEADLTVRGKSTSRSSSSRQSITRTERSGPSGSATRAKAKSATGGSYDRGSTSRKSSGTVKSSSGRSSEKSSGYYRKTTGSSRGSSSGKKSGVERNTTRTKKSGEATKSSRSSSGSYKKSSSSKSSGDSKSSSGRSSSGSYKKSSSSSSSSGRSGNSSSGSKKSSGDSRSSGGSKKKSKP